MRKIYRIVYQHLSKFKQSCISTPAFAWQRNSESETSLALICLERLTVATTARFMSDHVCSEMTTTLWLSQRDSNLTRFGWKLQRKSKMSTQITRRLTCIHILKYDKSYFGYHNIFVSDHVCLEIAKKLHLRLQLRQRDSCLMTIFEHK